MSKSQERVEQYLIDNPEGGRCMEISNALGIKGKDGASSTLLNLVSLGKVDRIFNNMGTIYRHSMYSKPLLCELWPSPVHIPESGKETKYFLLDR